MIFWYFCALIWFKNIEKMLLQMTSGFLQLESTLQKMRTFFFVVLFYFLTGLSQNLKKLA
jgi:hypothetical protein